jgi:AcrR family transcriptional regulator
MNPARPAAKRSRDPQESRRALLRAAAEIFNSEGYFATDSNRIARAAGYAPGTFYTHFTDKRAIFLAVYEEWVTAEMALVEAVLSETGEPRAARRRFAEAVLGHHRRWRVFRASLRALYATDPQVHDARLAQRARQIAQTERLLAAKADRAAILTSMLVFEVLCDSIADGDIAALGVEEAPLIDRLVEELDKLV